jgi:5-methylcytosine-specific restriction endonuclease McrA
LSRKLTHEEVRKFFEEHSCELLSEYKNSSSKVKYRCSCGNVSFTTFSRFKRGERCWKCRSEKIASKIRCSIEYVRELFAEKGFILLEDTYKDSKTKMRCICPCGNETYKTLDSVRAGQKCRECGYRNRDNGKFSYDYVKKYFEENGCVLLEGEYKGAHVPMRYICQCGNISTIRFTNFRRGARCRKCGAQKYSGENHYLYNPNLTEEERERHRLDKRLKTWRLKVKERDNFKCKLCGDDRGGNLVAHHLNGYDNFKEERYEISNGITLCESCHTKFHSKYGYGGNTREQFEEFIRLEGKTVEEVFSHENIEL